MSVGIDIPNILISLDEVVPPPGDVVDCRIHLGATKEVSSFELRLQNWNKKYSPGGTYPILVGKTGGIGIGLGTYTPALISLRIEGVKYENPRPNENYVVVSGRCWGEKLFRKTITKTYLNKTGQEVVRDIIENYAELNHTRNEIDQITDTDTTYTLLEYEDTPIWDVLKYIASTADKNGIIGFDFRVAPDGIFEFFPRGDKTSQVSLTDKLEVAEYSKDISRVRNKIIVWGYQARDEPADMDSWTESTTGWVSDYGDIQTSLDRQIGSYSIEDLTNGNLACFRRNIDAMKIDEGAKISFYFKTGGPTVDSVVIRLKSASNGYFSAKIPKGEFNYDTWDLKVLECGKSQVYDAVNNPTGTWTKVGTPTWHDINSIEFEIAGQGGFDTHVDGLHFTGLRFKAVAEDTTSQTNYGIREYVEVDEELQSNNECMLRAQALLNYLKDPAEYLKVTSTIVEYENSPILAADTVNIILPNENINGNYRVETAEYYVDAKNQTLQLTLELGKVPPQLADYMYGLRRFTVNVENLSRTKLGKKTGGGGVASDLFYDHHDRHEAGDKEGNKWVEGDGGQDAISGWIAPAQIGPYADTPSQIKFRTKNIAGTQDLDHAFYPATNKRGCLGFLNQMWKDLWVKYIYLGDQEGYIRYKLGETDEPLMLLDKEKLAFGPGESTVVDVHLKRIDAKKLEFKCDSFLPSETDTVELGDLYHRLKKIWANDFFLWNHLIPAQHNTFDLGKSDCMWRDLYLAGVLKAVYQVACNLIPDTTDTRYLGNADVRWIIHGSYVNCNTLNINGTEVIGSDKVIRNVTISPTTLSERIGLDKMPTGDSGKFLKATGATTNPYYENITAGDVTSGTFDTARIPNLDAAKITSGILAEARIPHTLYNYMYIAELECPLIHGGDLYGTYHGWVQTSQITGGVSADVPVVKPGGGTRTLHFVSGLYIGYTDS